jgi:hypothetical protein
MQRGMQEENGALKISRDKQSGSGKAETGPGGLNGLRI